MIQILHIGIRGIERTVKTLQETLQGDKAWEPKTQAGRRDSGVSDTRAGVSDTRAGVSDTGLGTRACILRQRKHPAVTQRAEQAGETAEKNAGKEERKWERQTARGAGGTSGRHQQAQAYGIWDARVG